MAARRRTLQLKNPLLVRYAFALSIAKSIAVCAVCPCSTTSKCVLCFRNTGKKCPPSHFRVRLVLWNRIPVSFDLLLLLQAIEPRLALDGIRDGVVCFEKAVIVVCVPELLMARVVLVCSLYEVLFPSTLPFDSTSLSIEQSEVNMMEIKANIGCVRQLKPSHMPPVIHRIGENFTSLHLPALLDGFA